MSGCSCLGNASKPRFSVFPRTLPPVAERIADANPNISATGAIASMGNTGYGYGYLGWACTIGGADAWMCTEFFRQYALGQDILGGTHSSAITSYIQNFGKYEDGDRKEISQFILLGDPSLQIGGT